jgi:branched-chain amino acid transport system permease protein
MPDVFTIILIANGLLVGMMYALIALGFVLVYKATEAFNFAQGEFVMTGGFIAAAAATVLPFWVATLLSIAGLVAFCFGLERVVLRPLLGRPIIAVIMATIGVASLLRGVVVLLFGSGTRALTMPIQQTPIFIGPIMLPPIDIVGAVVSLLFFGVFTWLFLHTRMGLAMRAVADNQQIASAMGIDVRRYFAIAWALTGVVSALGGVIWGALLGVDNQLAVVGLKVFPVVILGGFESVAGAIIGGLVVGVVESLSSGYIDPLVGGGTKDFMPYVLMIAVLMVRPYGIFGKAPVQRV